MTQWVLFHEDSYTDIVNSWLHQFVDSSPDKQLVLLYSCNDIIQKSRKYAPVFVAEFGNVLETALSSLSPDTPASIKSKMGRVISIWKERGMYSNDFSNRMLAKLKDDSSNMSSNTAAGELTNDKPTSSIQSNNPLVNLYLEHEKESVQDALVLIEAEELSREFRDRQEQSIDLGTSFLQECEQGVENHINRMKESISRKEELIQILEVTLGREKRALEHTMSDLENYEECMQSIQLARSSLKTDDSEQDDERNVKRSKLE